MSNNAITGLFMALCIAIILICCQQIDSVNQIKALELRIAALEKREVKP